MSKITIDNEEYKLDELSDKARSYAEHCHDLQNKILNSDTHQEIFNKLKIEYQNKYKSFFNLYESFRYQNKNIELTKIFRTFISAK